MNNKEEQIDGALGEGFLRTAGGPYALPTTIRKLINKEYNIDFLKKDEKIKYFLGVGIGALADLVSAAGYPFVAINCEVPEVLYFPLLTNSVSLMYEIGNGLRYLKKRLEAKLEK